MTNQGIIQQVKDEAKRRIRELTGLTTEVDVKIKHDVSELAKSIYEVTGLEWQDIVSVHRYRHYVDARRILVMMLLDRGLTLKQVGEYIERNYSTVINLRDTGNALIEADIDFCEKYYNVIENLHNNETTNA